MAWDLLYKTMNWSNHSVTYLAVPLPCHTRNSGKFYSFLCESCLIAVRKSSTVGSIYSKTFAVFSPDCCLRFL